MVVMATRGLLGFQCFGTFMHNKILGIVPNLRVKWALVQRL